jgi:predicted RND superfamily exporter protein
VLAVGLRRRRDAVTAVSAAVLSTGWGLAAVWALGISLSPLTVALGSLTTATACEFTVMLANAREHRRLRHTVGVAALSAALGYAVLAASGLAVIREFGLLLAVTVGLSYLAARLVVGRRGVIPVLPAEPRTAEPRVEEKL